MQSGDYKKFIPKKEFWAFGFGALGQGMIYSIMSSYISDFYINVIQLPLMFVLLLMLLARVWDAVNDPIMGIIVDKSMSKWGKMRPYIFFSAIPICALTFFMFFDPKLPPKSAMVYAGFIYVLWGMCYTVADVPFWSLPNIMTPDAKERGSLINLGRTLNGVGGAIPMAVFMALGFVLPALFPTSIGVDLERKKYIIMAIIFSLVGIILYVRSSFYVKERLVVPPKKEKAKVTLKRILTCKPLMLVVCMGILSSGRYMAQAASVHIARYAFYIGPALEGLSEVQRTSAISASVSAVSTIFTVCSAVGMFGSMLFLPLLYKKFEYKTIVIFSCVAGCVASVATMIMGSLGIVNNWSWTVYACIPFLLISAIPLGVLNVVSYAMIGDSLDYMEWKTGYRDNALGSACQSFVNKLGNALATTLIVVMYMAINLDPSQMLSSKIAVAAVELSVDKRLAMFSLVSLVPAISLILCAIPIFFYPMSGANKAKILGELAQKRQSEKI